MEGAMGTDYYPYYPMLCWQLSNALLAIIQCSVGNYLMSCWEGVVTGGLANWLFFCTFFGKLLHNSKKSSNFAPAKVCACFQANSTHPKY